MGSVLIVDDEAVVRRALTEFLTQPGRHVFAAGSGAEALRLLDGSEVPRPCLLLLDLLLRPMPGKDFLSSLQTRDDLAQLYLVIVSGDPQAPGAGVDSEVVASLPQPFDLTVLEGLLQMHG